MHMAVGSGGTSGHSIVVSFARGGRPRAAPRHIGQASHLHVPTAALLPNLLNSLQFELFAFSRASDRSTDRRVYARWSSWLGSRPGRLRRPWSLSRHTRRRPA